MSETSTRKRILVVDDERDLRAVVSLRLVTCGFEPLTAANGEEGLQVAASQQPDLVLLDVRMPNMQGIEVCKRLKTDPKTKDIPVIFLSALGLTSHIKAGMEAGADDYIIKPYHGAELKDRIMDCLARRNGG